MLFKIQMFIDNILRVIDYLPVIWKDRDYDPYYFWILMSKKMDRWSKHQVLSNHIGCEKQAKDIHICSLLAKRLAMDVYAHFKYNHWANEYDRLLAHDKSRGYKCTTSSCTQCTPPKEDALTIGWKYNHEFEGNERVYLDRLYQQARKLGAEQQSLDYALFCKLLNKYPQWWD